MNEVINYEPALAYIEAYWPQTLRHTPKDVGTLIGLPCPYLVPRASASGGGMFQEMYYWDSYFISLGLLDSEHEPLIVDMAENFAYMIERFGLIPNGSRFYFLSRSQPPFFTQQVNLACRVKRRLSSGDLNAYLGRMLALAEQEHNTVWLGQEQPHHRRVYRGLSRYFDINYLHILAACESGWDHSTRCDDAWLDHLPVDLNCILYARECDMAEWASTLGQSERAARWRDAARARQETIHELMWDAEVGFFFDYNWRTQARNPHPSLAGFYPLWARLASPEQAAQIVQRWLPRFLQPGGLVTTLQASPDRQWAWPNGWAPLQWIVVAGLDHYGYHREADEIRRRWCQNCAAVFERSGTFIEKYNVVPQHAVESGVYGQLIGFGWSNAVFRDFVRKLTGG